MHPSYQPCSTTCVLVGSGRILHKRAESIAHDHQAELINYFDPGSHSWRHWFEIPNRGHPFDAKRTAELRTALKEAGVTL